MQTRNHSGLTGARKIDARALHAAEYAKAFHGLDADGPKPGQILAVVKAALPHLVEPRRLGQVRQFFDLLFKTSFPQDWRGDNRPIVWPSNDELGYQLGLEKRSVQRLVRYVWSELGLIEICDSANGKRFGRRDPVTRQIVFAYGFDLSPLAVRLDELRSIAEQGSQRRQDARQAKRRLSCARTRIYQALAALADAGIDGVDPDDIAAEADDFAARGKTLADPGQIRSLAAALEDRLAELHGLLAEASNAVDEDDNMTPKGGTGVTHITTTKPSSIGFSQQGDNRRSPNGEQISSPVAGADAPADSAGRDKAGAGCEAESHPERIEKRPLEASFTNLDLWELSPRLQYAIPERDRATWEAIIRAARTAAGRMGISPHAVAVAEQAMTPPRVAACIAIIDAKSADIGSPGGYLRAMTERFRDGALDLETTLYLLKRRLRH